VVFLSALFVENVAKVAEQKSAQGLRIVAFLTTELERDLAGQVTFATQVGNSE
jgi:hypothetical protein